MSNGEHHDELVAFNNHEAGVTAAILAVEFHTVGRPSNFFKPPSKLVGSAAQAVAETLERAQQSLSQEVNYELGQSASDTAAMMMPAAAAMPLRALSLLMRRLKEPGICFALVFMKYSLWFGGCGMPRHNSYSRCRASFALPISTSRGDGLDAAVYNHDSALRDGGSE